MSTIISAPLVFGQESVPEEETRRVLGCSFPMDRHFSVTALGQSSQLRLYYFVGAGFIPYTVEEDGYKVPETVVLINLKQDRAVVQYLWHDGNALTFSQSPFLLRRHSWGWQVSKGPFGAWDTGHCGRLCQFSPNEEATSLSPGVFDEAR
jgi:hypothetical protein